MSLFVIALLVAGGVYAKRIMPEPLTVVSVTKGDVLQTKKAVGIVTADQDMQLKFAGTDSVQEVLVKEGDHVKKGQTLAKLRSDSLDGVMMTAQAALQSAQIQLQAVRSGTRSEDLAVTQAQVDSKKAELERARQKLQGGGVSPDLKQQQAIHLAGEVSATSGIVSGQYSLAKVALASLHNVFERLDVQDSLVKVSSSDYLFLQSQMTTMQQALDFQSSTSVQAIDANMALGNLQLVRNAAESVSNLLDRGADILSRLHVTDAYTVARQESAINAVAQQQSQVHSGLSTIDTAIKNLQDAAMSADGSDWQNGSGQSVNDLQAEIKALEGELRIDEAELQLKKAPPLSTDLALAMARVTQAQGGVDRVSAQLKDTLLIAPTDGIVTRVSITPGEFPPMNDPAIVLRGATDRSVLVYLSDADKAKIGATSSAYITFDAYPGTKFALRADEITASTASVNGIDTYRKLEFLYPHPELTVGMSGEVNIVIGEQKNVLMVPSDSLHEDASGQTFVRIKLDSGDTLLKPVVAGLTGDNGMTEVVGGLSGNETLVISPSANGDSR